MDFKNNDVINDFNTRVGRQFDDFKTFLNIHYIYVRNKHELLILYNHYYSNKIYKNHQNLSLSKKIMSLLKNTKFWKQWTFLRGEKSRELSLWSPNAPECCFWRQKLLSWKENIHFSKKNYPFKKLELTAGQIWLLKNLHG